MFAATAVTVQLAVLGRSESGLSVIELVPEPLTVKVSGVAVGHSSENELVDAVTGSLKFTTMFVFTATWSAASAGEVLDTLGAESCVANEKLEFAGG